MRLVTFRLPNATQSRIGALVEGGVASLSDDPRTPYADTVSLLEAGPEGLRVAAEVVQSPRRVYTLDEVHLGPPVPRARKLFALAGNYLKHVEESRKVTQGTTMTPRVFMKPPSTTLVGPGDTIVLGPHAQAVDWEAELAVVIGRRGKGIRRDEAMDYVAGYSCFNDISEREFRIFPRDETAEWDRFFDWLNGKWGDSFAPMGPALVTRDEVPDPHGLDISLSVNGELKQSSNTGRMIFDVGTIIEFISAFCTLEPGDIIAMGTPEGVGHARGERLRPGDEVEVRISGLGTLRNPVG